MNIQTQTRKKFVYSRLSSRFIVRLSVPASCHPLLRRSTPLLLSSGLLHSVFLCQLALFSFLILSLHLPTVLCSLFERKKKMEHTSKDLLHLERRNSSTSSIESALLVCNNKDLPSQSKKPNPDKKPICNPVAKSQVLDKVKGFLGVISESNKRLQLDAKGNAQDYDIEVLTGNESEIIEMDLMLGVADLHTPEAVSAAESVIAGNQPVIPLATSSSETDTNDDSDDSDGDDDEDTDDYDDNKDNKTDFPQNLERSETSKGNSVSKAAEKKQSKKRPKIVELS